MENQHKKISGYRDLTQAEIDLMNKIKAKGAELGDLIDEVKNHIRTQRAACLEKVEAEFAIKTVVKDQDAFDQLEKAEPERFAAMAKTELQTGLMYLTRAVAQPTNF